MVKQMVLTRLRPVMGEVSGFVFFDFDETYYPHACTTAQKQSIWQLEDCLNRLALEKGLKTAWITGSSLDHIFEKMAKASMRFAPHYIGANLGTELYEVTAEGQVKPVAPWGKRLPKADVFEHDVSLVVAELENVFHISLQEQTRLGESTYKQNYYYFPQNDTLVSYHLQAIEQVASTYGMAVNWNQCNPKAGDPEGAYDVDFIPLRTGKKEVAAFLCSLYRLTPAETWAFGDSGNDLEMVAFSKNGYLVANATSEAKAQHAKITKEPYAAGIVALLKQAYHLSVHDQDSNAD